MNLDSEDKASAGAFSGMRQQVGNEYNLKPERGNKRRKGILGIILIIDNRWTAQFCKQ